MFMVLFGKTQLQKKHEVSLFVNRKQFVHGFQKTPTITIHFSIKNKKKEKNTVVSL